MFYGHFEGVLNGQGCMVAYSASKISGDFVWDPVGIVINFFMFLIEIS